MSILTCDKKGPGGRPCGNEMFVEEYATQIIPPPEGQGKNESGKVTQLIGSGKYFYRCTKCGKMHQFYKTEADDDLAYTPSQL